MTNDKCSFTAVAYEDGTAVIEKEQTFDTADDAIAFAKSHNWDNVINDLTGSFIWSR